MIEMKAPDGVVGNSGLHRIGSSNTPPPTPGDPPQKPSETPQEPHEIPEPPPREIPPAPGPNEGDRERAARLG